MDIDAASVASPAPEDTSLPSDGQEASELALAQHSMQTDISAQPVALAHSVHHPQQQMLQSQDGRAHSHTAAATALTFQSMPQAGSSHGHLTEAVPPHQTASHSFASSAAQLQGLGFASASQVPGFAASPSGQGTRHGTATGSRDSFGGEEQQGAAPLQHASSTSAMLSLAQQASQASWASQQAVKRNSRYTGPCSMFSLQYSLVCIIPALNCTHQHMPMSDGP